jgi:general secretion pathway protein D
MKLNVTEHALMGLFFFFIPLQAAEQAHDARAQVAPISPALNEKLTLTPETALTDKLIKQSNYEDLSFSVEDNAAQDDVADDSHDEDNDKRKFDINFESADLIDVINRFSTESGKNILIPTGANEIKSKLTLKVDERVTVEQAEKLLYTVLDVAGYSLIKRLDGFAVVKNDNNIARSVLPIFIGVSPDELPDTDERIRYFYYFSNIQVPANGTEGQSELNSIFQQILPPDAVYRYIPSSNGVLLVDKANDIKAVMKIVLEMDKIGFKENLEIVKLTYTNAQVVADLFNTSILNSADQINKFRVGFHGKSQAEYFSPAMKIIPETRTNSLILLGSQQAIERVKDFIFRYLDVQLETGKSILHVYQLQYLEASTFAKTLENLVNSSAQGGVQGQSRAAGQTVNGPERFFEGVIIRADTPSVAADGTSSSRYFGGNQLVIAARNEDWLRIKKLIEELDRPQPQVIIEVLIADIVISDELQLGTHTRMPSALNLPGAMQGQAADTELALGKSNGDATSSINVDLLNQNGYTTAAGTVISPLQAVTAGSTVISLNDANGTTWSILQLLQAYDNSKVLAHPHVIATNNQKAIVEIGEIRQLPGEGVTGQGGATIAKYTDKEANMRVEITPRISGGEVVNMQVKVKFNEFVGNTSDRLDREVVTNANVQSSTILVLGGMIKITNQQGMAATPLLSRIPVLGYLFKNKTGNNEKDALTVFIRPTIVMPRLRGGIDRYTKDYIKVAKNYVDDNMLFDTLRDPVTRWFFSTGVDAKAAIDTFATENQAGASEEEEVAESVKSKADMSERRLFTHSDDVTMLAAAEGRKSKKSKKDHVLDMKQELMDYSPRPARDIVAQHKAVSVPQQEKTSQHAKKKMVNTPTVVAQKPAPSRAPAVSREEQLKQLLVQQDNPLLTI